MQSDSSRRSHRPTTPSRISLLPAYSSPISPHIRTPSPSTSSSPPRRSMRLNKQLQFVASRLPRPVLRGLVLLTIITALIFLTSSVRHSLDEGVWDASSYSDRRGVEGGGLGGFRRKLSYWAIPSHSSDIPLVPASVPRPKGARPYRAQPNATLVRQAHQGFSRTPIIGQSEYNLGPLPSLEQAFARLEPKLREIKDGVPSIPREHALWSPILAPHITEHHQERYHHLRSDWDEQIQDWVPSTKRYLFVTVCRDVAGEWDLTRESTECIADLVMV